MSDEEHHFESKADAGASKTYPQQAGTIRKNGYIVIKSRPCKVVEVSTSKTGKHGHAKCHFVGIDIFNGKKLEDIVPSSHNCDVPHVNRTDYQLIDISEDGFVSLLTESGDTKDDLRLPTDDSLLKQCVCHIVETHGHKPSCPLDKHFYDLACFTLGFELKVGFGLILLMIRLMIFYPKNSSLIRDIQVESEVATIEVN
ncbi:hypothetical protein TIFTF001_005205 [Ficus carica]|uniref:Translation initiation factor 5A C-terminal domain-containing protein n=1 Tax=Ficus carica TaxID=3494 RepID=A0AA87ZL43_FICCA|nr:hypothetical protein TIFTF001_005205 [Ficus carica]